MDEDLVGFDGAEAMLQGTSEMLCDRLKTAVIDEGVEEASTPSSTTGARPLPICAAKEPPC